MGVDPADPFAKDSAPFDPFHGLLVAGRRNLGKHLEVAKNLAPVFETAKRQFTDDAGMGDNLLIVEQARQSGFLSPEMADPNRRIDKNHPLRSLRFQRRLRGAAEARVSAPPMAASLLAASRRTKASKPIRTREVFSVTPVRRDASAMSLSSIFSVVLICINMGLLDASVKAGH